MGVVVGGREVGGGEVPHLVMKDVRSHITLFSCISFLKFLIKKCVFADFYL